METPLTAFKLGSVARDDTPLVARMFEAVLDFCKGFLSQGFFEANVKMMSRAGYYGLPVAALVGFAFSMTLAIRLDTLSTFLYGFAWVLLTVVVQYTAVRFVGSGDQLVGAAPSHLSSLAVLDTFAVLSFLAGWLCLLGFLFQAIRLEELKLLWFGFGGFVIFEYLACVTMNPALINVTIHPRVTPGEEAVGLLSFLLKAALRLVPIAYGAGIVVGILWMGIDFFRFLANDANPYVALQSGGRAAELILDAGLLPLAAYFAFLVLHLVLGLFRAVLAVPLKLDVIARQLPAALERPGSRE